MLKAIKEKGIKIDAIFIEIPEKGKLSERLEKCIRTNGVIGAIEVIFGVCIKYYKLFKRGEQELGVPGWLSNEYYHNYSNNVEIVTDFNGGNCEILIKDINPNIIILGGTRIIRENILNIPSIGTINAHPGLLPNYRGVDVIPWAIYNGDDIGVTVHFVNRGVDTGPIITKEIIKIEPGDNISVLRRKAEIIAGKLMSETLINIIKGANVQIEMQSKDSGKQYYKMPEKLLQQVEEKLGQST